MIRTVITPQKQSILIDIPLNYVGKEIEIIAFARDEETRNVYTEHKKVTFTALSIDTCSYKFNRDEANER